MSDEKRSRSYRKRKRADQEEQTRLRITEAAVQLHATVGPANTTMTEIAEHAGVSRMTVYNHFPTESDLLAACSTHWARSNPFPAPSAWREIEDPSERLRVALGELYGWYRGVEDMLANVIRDEAVLEPLRHLMEGFWWPYMKEVVRVLYAGRHMTAGGTGDLRAVLRLVVDFGTWQVLSRHGVEDERAAELAVCMVEGVSGFVEDP